MAFTTQLFLFVFFPLCFFIYYLVLFLESRTIFSKIIKKIRLTDLVLIGISSIFYGWALFDDVFRFAIYILLVYILGFIIQAIKNIRIYLVTERLSSDGSIQRKQYLSLAFFILSIAIIFCVYILIHFKYEVFLIRIWNFLTRDSLTGKSILAPLGISFITFSAISYLSDIYMEKAYAGNLVDCALYLSFFPKVVSGPIVLWRDFKNQITERKVTSELIVSGINRIMIGFAKKLILADTFGACIASAAKTIDVPTAWGISLLYMLQLYYDFSGYSDIAIGLSKMFGFSFKENFNFPYLSSSISELWRRWHISLGTWFREYIYIPLGGSKCGIKRTVINISIVFLLTGIWHGVGFAYILWGLANGICIILEKLISNYNWYKKIPRFVKWISSMCITFFCWIPFRFGSITKTKDWLKNMFFDVGGGVPYTWEYYFDTRMIVLLAIGIIGATIAGLPVVRQTYRRFIEKKLIYLVQEFLLLALFIIAILFMVSSTYSPFIYFQY